MKKIETGCIVAFKEVKDLGDEKARMVVLDDYGDDCSRCMVQYLGTNLPLAPTQVILKSELIVIVSAKDIQDTNGLLAHED